MYFLGKGTIWDEQASACSFKGHWRGIPDAGLWIFGDIITIHHQCHDYRGQTELKHFKNGKYEKWSLCGF